MNIVRSSAIAGLLLTGCLTVRGAGADSNSIPPRPADAPYPNWEHMCVQPTFGSSTALLNEAGEQGWELVAVTGEGAYCFKRPVLPPGGGCPHPPGRPPPPPPPPDVQNPFAGGAAPPLPPPPPPPPEVQDPFGGGDAPAAGVDVPP